MIFEAENNSFVNIFAHGTFWFQNGEHHKDSGPAIIYANGDKYWYKNGKPHRDDGPAVVYVDGKKYFYLEGKICNEKNYWNQTKK